MSPEHALYLFRADANETIGAGHMMRCLTIAQALRDSLPPGQASRIVFVCADETGAALPRQAGFRTEVTGTGYRDMESELPFFSTLFSENRLSASGNNTGGTAIPARPVLIVDSYYVTDTALAVLRAFSRVVLIEDDLTRTFPVDRVINYNLQADAAAYQALYGADGTRFCTGPSFAPVRPQFLNRGYTVRNGVRQILLLSGGSDPGNAAGAVYRALKENLSPCPPVTIVCGRFNAHRAALAAYEKKDPDLRVLTDVQDMASLMCESDLCVSACGSTIYELCALGVPFIGYALADNQNGIGEYLAANGPAPYCGAFHHDPGTTLQQIAAQVATLAGDPEARNAQSLAQRRLIDGQGAARIARQLTEDAGG